MNWWIAEEIWPGETCFIVCGGPSLIGFDFDRLRGRKVIAINSSVFSLPFSDFLFFGDARWWDWNGERVSKEYSGCIVTTSEADAPNVKRMEKRSPPPALSADRHALTVRNTSLTGGMNLALHFGCKRIVLLGVDMEAGEDGATHHHEPHPVRQVRGCWDRQMKELQRTAYYLRARNVEVLNTSEKSRIGWWPKTSIQTALNL